MPIATDRRKAKAEPTPEPVAQQPATPPPAAEEPPSGAAALAASVASTLPSDPETDAAPKQPEPQEWGSRLFNIKTYYDHVVLEMGVAANKGFYQAVQQIQTQLFAGMREQMEAEPCVVRAREADKRLAAARARDDQAQATVKAIAEEHQALLSSADTPETLADQLVTLEARRRAAQSDATAGAVAILAEQSTRLWQAAREELTVMGRDFADHLCASMTEQQRLEYERLVSRSQFTFTKLALLNKVRDGNELRRAADAAVQGIISQRT